MQKDPDLSSISARGFSLEIFGEPARQRSGLPYVSWEPAPKHRDEEERIDAIPYPVDPPDGEPGLADDEVDQARAFLAAIQSLVKRGVPQALHLTVENLKTKCLAATRRERAHHGLTRPFYSWPVEDEKLFTLAGIRTEDALFDLKYLVEPTECVLRYSQGGDGLVGADPRLVAWRAWRLFEHCEHTTHDLLMDLRSFAWYSLQHQVKHDRFILGGSRYANDQNSSVAVMRLQDKVSWFVRTLPPYVGSIADYTVAIMS